MHIEILTEDSSSKLLLEHLMPKLIGQYGKPHSWRAHAYRGIGRVPTGVSASVDPSKRVLLDRLPALRGYVKTPGIDAVVVVLDSDTRDCSAFLAESRSLATSCGASHVALFRLAIEEIEAWYLGDRVALLRAYPNARTRTLDHYVQDSICNTWELVAEVPYQGGVREIRKAGWPLPGQIKHEWADGVGPLLDSETNQSPSFKKLRDGLRRLVASALES